MKRIIKSMLTVALFLGLIFFNTSVVSAANITALNVNGSDNKIAVSGSCDAGVLACAILVYDSTGATLLDMETCAASGGTYSYTLSNTFAAGDYVVKVADYNGGDYNSKTVSVTGTATASTPATVPTSPKTNENYLYNILLAVGLAATALSVYFVRRYDKAHK